MLVRYSFFYHFGCYVNLHLLHNGERGDLIPTKLRLSILKLIKYRRLIVLLINFYTGVLLCNIIHIYNIAANGIENSKVCAHARVGTVKIIQQLSPPWQTDFSNLTNNCSFSLYYVGKSRFALKIQEYNLNFSYFTIQCRLPFIMQSYKWLLTEICTVRICECTKKHFRNATGTRWQTIVV